MDNSVKVLQELPEDLQEKISKLRDNMLIVMADKSGGRLEFTIDEVDSVHGKMVVLGVEDGKFVITSQERQLS
jgi:hypothetical protein